MSPICIRTLACVALFACSSVDALAEFGRTRGSFNVSGGAATYTIPVWTPPGPNGLTPSIALTYNSTSGNGVGGVGWHISAVSSIERCARTKHQDTNAGAVDLTLNDRFCIGGNRLRLYGGTAYGAVGSVYYTEIADYSRITAYGTAGNGPAYFIVEAKTGVFKDIKTDGPPELGTCVSNALNGLTLPEPDDNHGDATFSYQFTVGAPAAS